MARTLPADSKDEKQHPPLSYQNVSDVDYLKDFMLRLTNLRDDNEHTDVILKAGDKELPCHRVVLVAASEYFKGMFTSGLEEAKSGVIEIKGTDSETMSTLLQYIYSGNVQLTSQNVQRLVQASDQFQFNGLKRACEEFLVKQVDPSNCIGFYKFSKLYALRRLQKSARRVMVLEFPKVVRATEFNQLSVADLIEYISDDAIDIVNEDTVYEAVCIWVRHDLELREQYFPEIVAQVRLPFCSSVYLCRVVSSSPFMTSPVCHNYLEEARRYHMVPDKRHELCSPRTVPRAGFVIHRCLVVIGGLDKEDRENRHSWFLPLDGSTWELLAQLPRPLGLCKFYSVCATAAGLLLTGGYHNEVKRECWLFETTEKKWRAVEAMSHGRCKHGSVLHNGSVYVLGGEDDTRPVAAVERLDPRQRRWLKAPKMLKALSEPLVVAYSQYIYVMSGIDVSDATSQSTMAYDAVWGEWSWRADMPKPCRLGAAAIVNDHIYVVGGYTRSCMSYDPRSDVWTCLALPREKHGNAPAVVWKGKILVGGGDIDGNETTSIIEEYDPDKNAWSYWDVPLIEELSCHHLLNIDLYGV